ncbi:MAG: nitroreductase [Deltaproteobacteria bacterium HGW-Deltaproteobacteria-17]|nr:MAG: nitroreductase [Deltaproteobacteria bacterium HGW-Deltaproteobacteria-17]
MILERRSVRKYKDKQVPENVIRRIMEAGRFAPSAGNSQPWKLLVIRDPAMLQKMERDVRISCKLAASFIDWRTSPLGRTASWLTAQTYIRAMPNLLAPVPFGALTLIGQGKLGLYHGAPTVILMLMDKRGVAKPQVDIGICGQNMVLAAHSMGLGTCWIGFVELLAKNPIWRHRLGIKYPYKLVEGITIGYPIGHPDGIIERETHASEWYENGTWRTVY